MQYKLQNILLPDPLVCDEVNMYVDVKNHSLVTKDKIEMKKWDTCSFATYFNSFSLNKWKYYTQLNSLGLELHLKGTFNVKIYAAALFKKKVTVECLEEVNVISDGNEAVQISCGTLQKECIYFTITALESNCEFYGGSYYTDIEESALNPVDIDMVMCTFKREPYLLRNLALITSFMKNDAYNACGHIHVKIVDNDEGRVLREKIQDTDEIHLYPNLNVGGSGGFCRGMMEALKEGHCTHILFMDDDVLIQVEALERTYNMLRLLKKGYDHAFLGGAMFRLDSKSMQHENRAGFKGNHLVSLKGGLDMNKFKNVLFNEKLEKVNGIYGAWWFCCIPVTVASLNNLPYPFFIRMDDIEYSIRNVDTVISLNGISVWHEAFDKKYSSLMENYFMFRNNMVVNMVHNTGNLKLDLKFFFRRFARDIFRYDYGGAELLLDGVENFLKGPTFYKTVDTIKDLKAHGGKQEKQQSMKDISGMDLLENDFKAAIEDIGESKLVKWIRFVTWNGHLLPSIFFKPFGYAEYGYSCNSKMYFLKKNVLACSPNFDTGVQLKIKRGKFIKLLIRFFKLNIFFVKKYGSLKQEYTREFKTMTSEQFWLDYLKIKGNK